MQTDAIAELFLQVFGADQASSIGVGVDYVKLTAGPGLVFVKARPHRGRTQWHGLVASLYQKFVSDVLINMDDLAAFLSIAAHYWETRLRPIALDWTYYKPFGQARRKGLIVFEMEDSWAVSGQSPRISGHSSLIQTGFGTMEDAQRYAENWSALDGNWNVCNVLPAEAELRIYRERDSLASCVYEGHGQWVTGCPRFLEDLPPQKAETPLMSIRLWEIQVRQSQVMLICPSV